MLTLLVISMLTLAFNIQQAKASGTIYIRADGSVDPPTANITSTDNVTYYFTDNNYDEIVVEKSNIIIDGNGYTLQGTGSVWTYGFYLSGINNVTIQNVDIRSFMDGVYIHASSSYNTISGSNITNNDRIGVFFGRGSSSSIVSGNNITNSNSYGIYLDESSNVTVSGNYITNNKYGIYLDGSSNVTLRNNTITDSDHWNFGVIGTPLSHFIHDVDESNTVNGKPIYYWVNHRDMKVPSDAGYVALINSTNVTVEGAELKNNDQGILLAYTTNSQVTNNNITNNGYGVRPTWSSNITFSRNNISNNFRGIWLSWSPFITFSENNIIDNEEGIGFYASSGNRMYHNNFINNTWHLSPYSISSNVWDNGYPSGGNYWSGYTGVDEKSGPNQDQLGSDGIGDTPYVIDGNNNDSYPLMKPWTPPADPTTWYVDDDGGADFTSIQEAINSPEVMNGDIIYVYNGTYYENVVVNKTVSLVGENENTTVIDGSGTGTIVRITANNVMVSNFTIRNGGHLGGGTWPDAGIWIDNSHNATMKGNIITNSAFGVFLYYSNRIKVKENTISSNSQFGLYLAFSTDNVLIENIVKDNPYVGVGLQGSGNNTFRDNNITGNWYNFGVQGDSLFDYIQDIDTSNEVNGKPIYYLVNQNDTIFDSFALPNAGYLALVNSTRVTVKDISLKDNFQGFLLAFTTYSTVQNIHTFNNSVGIYLDHSNNNHFTGNVLSHLIFGCGMQLDYSNENTLIENDFANMSYGIFLWFSHSNLIYHNNFIDNRVQVDTFESSNNMWDNGYPSGGNYWSNYTGVDLDYDGIGDTPHLIDENNQDNYPLMEPWTPLPRTIDELKTEIEKCWSEGEIDNQGIVNSLIVKLNVAQKLVDKGKINEAKSILEDDLIPQVQNLSGIHITVEAADILIQSAEHIISKL